MIDKLMQDWPVYILAAAIISFFVYAVVKSKKQERRKQNEPGKFDNKPKSGN